MIELNKETKWLHYPSYSIPIYENVLYALKLFQNHTKEDYLLGKEHLEKIFPFEVDGNFPEYLHQWPKCYHQWQSIDLLLPLYWIKKEGVKIDPLIDRLLNHAWSLEKLPLLAEIKRAAVTLALGKKAIVPSFTLIQFKEDEQLFDLLTIMQLLPDQDISYLEDGWSQELGRYISHTKQEGDQPYLTLLSRALRGEKATSVETLPLQLLHHFENPITTSTKNLTLHEPYTQFWGNKDHIHSLTVIGSPHVKIDKNLIITYDETLPCLDLSDEAKEVKIFLSRQLPIRFTVDNLPTNSFKLGETCRVSTPLKQFKIMFSLKKGKGEFLAHIIKGNRPSQILKDGEAYDWVIALRTLRREPGCQLLLKIEE